MRRTDKAYDFRVHWIKVVWREVSMMSGMRGLNCVALLTVIVSLFAARAYGQADFEGIWTPNNPPGALLMPPLDEVNLTPAGRAELEAFSTDDDPAFRCIMPGIPKGFTDPYPLEIIQQEHQIVLLAEYYHQVRRIYMDGRDPPEFWPPTLAGYSNGHWEGDTLVVRTEHITADNITDPRGLPYSGSEDSYVIERYRREGDELKLAVEVHDPVNFEGPYLMNRSWVFTPDGEIWEYDCNSAYGAVD